MTNFTELNAKDMNEVNGGSVASTLAKVAQTAAKVIIYTTVPSYPLYPVWVLR